MGEKKLNDFQNLAVAQRIYHAIAGEVSTKSPDGLRGSLDAKMLNEYMETGTRTRDLIINGEKVGTYSVKVGKAKPGKVTKQLSVNDESEVARWAAANQDELSEFLSRNWDAFANYCFESYGEVPDGCEVVTTETEPVPPQPTGTVLRVDDAKVDHAMAGQLPQAVAGLLHEGE